MADKTDLCFLADESCDYAVVRDLRAAGYDVTAIADDSPGSEDREVLALAEKENRVVLTEDKDFGRLVFASFVRSPGVILIRFPGDQRSHLVRAVRRIVADQGQRLFGKFVVIEPGSTRIRSRL